MGPVFKIGAVELKAVSSLAPSYPTAVALISLSGSTCVIPVTPNKYVSRCFVASLAAESHIISDDTGCAPPDLWRRSLLQ